MVVVGNLSYLDGIHGHITCKDIRDDHHLVPRPEGFLFHQDVKGGLNGLLGIRTEVNPVGEDAPAQDEGPSCLWNIGEGVNRGLEGAAV